MFMLCEICNWSAVPRCGTDNNSPEVGKKAATRPRQRGRKDGRAARGRGRKWGRGASGGGTLRRDWPQVGHCSELTTSARSQWPLVSQCGFTHWTVEPGMKDIMHSPRGSPLTHGS